MPFVIGVVLAIAVGIFARVTGLDRDRAFYPTVLIVVASYYLLFAAMSDSGHALILELAVMAVFVGAAVAGYRSSGWVVAAGLAGHGVFDALHGSLVANPGVPAWWPAFCLAYDVGAAAWLAWFLLRQRAAPEAGALPDAAIRM